MQRELVGFVTSGEFSYLSGAGFATGFVAISKVIPALKALSVVGIPTFPLLVKNAGSLHFFAAVASFDTKTI